MNPSTAQARAMVDALIRSGVSDVVLAPGSRSAPLALALAAEERDHRVRLHVRIDERSAGFLALGLAKGSGRAVPVITTSGTAVANLLPAVVEASHAGVPLLALSADRPPWLRDVGAPQTIDQVHIFGQHARWFSDVAVATSAEQVGYWRSIVGRALARATDPGDPGPVHLNLPFAEPLVPDEDESGPMPAEPPRPVRAVATATPAPELAEALAAIGLARIPQHGLVVVGDLPFGWDPSAVAALADDCGWPIIAEPTAGLHAAATWVPAGSLVAGSPAWLAEHPPQFVMTFGRVGLAREVAALIRAVPHHLAVDTSTRWADPTRTADGVVGSVPLAPPRTGDRSWAEAWAAAGVRAARAVDAVLDDEAMFTGLHAARHIWRDIPDRTELFLASSWPIRQVQLTARARTGLRVLGNRGANGIDGLVSTAWGVAASSPASTVALLGDLAFLHDTNGLLAPAGEDRPQLQLVVTDNDGGGIFSQLEQASPRFAADFERVFGTPHGLHLVGRTRLCGVPGRGVDDLDTFVEAFAEPPPGVSVLVAQVADRASEAQCLQQIRSEARTAVDAEV